MAVEKNTGGSNFQTRNFGYSSFVGLIVDRMERAAYDAALATANVTDADVKKGFGTPESIKARAELKKVDITGYKLTGRLGYLAIREKNLGSEQKPNKQKFLTVGLNDGQDTMYLEVPYAHDAAGALARKLVNVEPGIEITISVFASMGDAGFANHGASVKTAAGEEVKGIPFGEGPGKVVDAQMAVLKSSGIEDKEVLSKAKRSALGSYNESIVAARAALFDAYHAANKGQSQAAAPAPADNAAQPDGNDGSTAASAVNNSFGDDDIPF